MLMFPNMLPSIIAQAVLNIYLKTEIKEQQKCLINECIIIYYWKTKVKYSLMPLLNIIVLPPISDKIYVFKIYFVLNV